MKSVHLLSLLILLLSLPTLSSASVSKEKAAPKETKEVSSAKQTKDISFKFKNSDPVVFSHSFHLEKYNNNCKVCHNAIFDLRKRKRFTMAEMDKTKSCGSCHTGIKAFSVKNEKSCMKCHKGKPRNITYKMKGATEVTFSHATHLAKAGVNCRSCHDGKVLTGKDSNTTMAQMEKGRTCGACHDGKKAFSVVGNCGNCHKGMQPRDITFKLKGVTDAVFSHQVHLSMYKCADCHTKIFPYKANALQATMASMESGKYCGACHNGKDAFTVAGECDKCHKGYIPGIITFKTDGGEVKFSHEFHLGIYKCNDCHTKLFPHTAGALKIGMREMDKGKSCGFCHNGKDAFPSSGDCKNCHKM